MFFFGLVLSGQAYLVPEYIKAWRVRDLCIV